MTDTDTDTLIPEEDDSNDRDESHSPWVVPDEDDEEVDPNGP